MKHFYGCCWPIPTARKFFFSDFSFFPFHSPFLFCVWMIRNWNEREKKLGVYSPLTQNSHWMSWWWPKKISLIIPCHWINSLFSKQKRNHLRKKRDTFNFFFRFGKWNFAWWAHIHSWMLCNIHKRFVVSSLNKKNFFRWVESLFLTFREDVMKLR